MVGLDDGVHLGQQTARVRRHGLTGAVVGLDLELAPPQHIVGVDEVLKRRVHLLRLGVIDVEPLPPEDGVHDPARVGVVVDHGDGLVRHPLGGAAAVVVAPADRPGRAGRGVVVDRRRELPATDAVGPVTGSSRRSREADRRAPPGGTRRRGPLTRGGRGEEHDDEHLRRDEDGQGQVAPDQAPDLHRPRLWSARCRSGRGGSTEPRDPVTTAWSTSRPTPIRPPLPLARMYSRPWVEVPSHGCSAIPSGSSLPFQDTPALGIATGCSAGGSRVFWGSDQASIKVINPVLTAHSTGRTGDQSTDGVLTCSRRPCCRHSTLRNRALHAGAEHLAAHARVVI